MFHINKIEHVRQTLLEEANKGAYRQLSITYVWGKTGAGKTRDVMEKYGYENVYRVTDYIHPFDGYKGQDVVVFEEFRSSLRIGEMLGYLEGYPLELPARYLNKKACFSKVYIISNIPLDSQYTKIQEDEKETWKALMRRIGKVKEYSATGVTEYPNNENFRPINDNTIVNPFDENVNEKIDENDIFCDQLPL
jgi:hypothetical protein